MILVTGATGILGRVIVLELLKQGKTVRATKRSTSDLEDVKQSFHFYTDNAETYFNKIEWVEVDFEDLDTLRSAFEGVEEVYHCAAIVSFHPKDKKKMYRTNIGGTKNLLYIAEEKSVNKFLFVSSIAVLDGINEEGMLDEASDFNSKLRHSSYAISKHFSEMEVWRASAEGMNVVVVNPGIIIGSGNWSQSSGVMFFAHEKAPYLFSGGMAYVDVRDVARCSITLMNQNRFGERFILISENRKYAELGNYIRQKLGLKPIGIIPSFVLKLARGLNVLLSWAIPQLRLFNKINIKMLSASVLFSNKKIKQILQYEFIPIDESLDFHISNYKMTKK